MLVRNSFQNITLITVPYYYSWEVWRALKKLELLARVARGVASINSNAPFVLSKLPTCFISR